MFYGKSYDGVLLHYLSQTEPQTALQETHDDVYNAHQVGRKLYDRLRKMEYYWP